MQESRAITRKSASNLALAFLLLPREKRDAMSALYAFCREIDDVADEEQIPESERRRALAGWRQDLRRAWDGAPEKPVNRELQRVIRRFHLPCKHFEELLQGVEMDLDIRRYASYAELETYCYRVASVVGLLSIEIFGYTDPACRRYAACLGQALQLTNILRDVRVDARRGRIYLPGEELARQQVSEDEVLACRYSGRFQQAAAAVARRAEEFYLQAAAALPAVDRRSMIAAELMGAVYWRLLRLLKRRHFDVFGPRPVRVGGLGKLALILRTWTRISLQTGTPNYGYA